MFCVVVFCAVTTCADTVVLRDGASYSGQRIGPDSGQIAFTDGQGIEYKFPASDVQSLVFGRTQDTVTVRSGKVYAGQYNGPEYVAFRDGQGIDYNFPLRDLETIIFTQNSASPAATTGIAVVIPRSTEIVVRIETIDSENSTTGALWNMGAGGAGLGALMRAIFGGGRGAGIGAAAGAGTGLLTQIFTRGKHVKVQAETTIHFRLDRTLVLRLKI